MGELSRAEVREAGEVEVVIDDFGFKGEGYVRLVDGWLSIPGALPGELVRVRVQPGQREGARRLYADVEAVLKPSSMRRAPLCDHDRICRGCQLRHLTVDGELRFKVRTVREVMARYAGLDEAMQPDIEAVAPQPIARGDAFRIRSTLSYRRCKDDFELGLYTPVRQELVPMGSCPALTKPLQRLVSTIAESLSDCQRLPRDSDDEGPVRLSKIRVVSPTHGVGLIDVELAELSDETQLESIVETGEIANWVTALNEALPDQVGIAVAAGEFRHIVSEPTRIRVPIGGWNMEIGYDDWVHATLEPAERVYARMLSWLDLEASERFLDIGCGTGTISLMASEQCAEVVGLDNNAASIEAAEINALGHGRANVDFVVGGWEKALRQLVMDDERFDVATINPMREPLGHRPLAFLEPLEVKRLVYLGPSPEAAAKDIGALREMGWTVQRLAAANLHPATYHAMLLALLVKDGPSEAKAGEKNGDN